MAIISLVLAAQFESFRDPLVILVTVPLSICGALIPLLLGISSMNIYTQVGLVTLIGATGAVSRFDIGTVIATGMSVGTLFTLIVLPCVYTLLAAPDNAFTPTRTCSAPH